MSELLEVDYVPRTVIEDQLLTALDDKSKVAFLLTKEDLNLLIWWGSIAPANVLATDKAEPARSRDMLSDLRKLRSATFKEGQ
jgi:hypothetical protein